VSPSDVVEIVSVLALSSVRVTVIVPSSSPDTDIVLSSAVSRVV
jgi:hypothetical protein